jgi:sugar lactone lactonase YvrE
MLAGCAPAIVGQFNVLESEAEEVWPKQPDIPRLRFAGTLRGETNYVQESSGGGFIRWLTGLGQGTERPRLMQRPSAGMVDSAGRVLVVDSGRGAVFVFDPDAGAIELWLRGAADKLLESPVSIAELPDGDFVVSDADAGAIYRLDSEGNPKGRWTDSKLARPTGLVWSDQAGQLYVSDTEAHEIAVFDHLGRRTETLGGPGIDPGRFNAPTHLAVDQQGLWVCDTFNARVQYLSFDGEPISAFGRRGMFIGNLTRPKGIAVLDDTIFVVESQHDHLLMFRRDGTYLLPVGGSGRGPGQFYLPAGMWSARGRIYVADMFNGRVTMFDFFGG